MPDDHQQDIAERPSQEASLADGASVDNRLEASIGRQVRAERRRMDMTVVELARLAGLSAGMLSKIENGVTSPSLGTLQSLARALNAPVTSLFTRFDEMNAAFVANDRDAAVVARRGSRHGYVYRQLGPVGGGDALECYAVAMGDDAAPCDTFQHAGGEFLYVVEGRMLYRHGDRQYELAAGDSIFYEADTPHGPVRFIETPVRVVLAMASVSR